MSFVAKTVLGVMSGTSLDGIDLALVHFGYEDSWHYDLLLAETVPYSKEWLNSLQQLTLLEQEALHNLNLEYTTFLAEVIHQFLEKHSIQNLDFVSSHGHTALHQPDKGLTFQLGNLPQLAHLIGQKVICDFRVADVALDGQGAPLVPGGEIHLFNKYSACVNLGGFANITQLGKSPPLAYDITAVNVVFNTLAQRKGLPYDKKGALARSGNRINALFDALNELEFYCTKTPKSLGVEWVNSTIFPLLDAFKNCTVEDLLHTYSQHCAYQIALQLPTKGDVLFTGGGAFNIYLIETIQRHANCKIILPTNDLIEFKEAVIFAFLGVLRTMNVNNCLASVTGASRDHCSGKIFLP